MHIDGSHPGLQQFRAAKAQQKHAYEIREEIKTQNPKIDPAILERLVQTRMEKEARAQSRRRPTHKPKSKRRQRKDRPINSLADKIKAIR